MNTENENITSTQVMLPVIMISIVVFLFLAFQTIILSEDRINFDTAMKQQQPMVEQVQKVKAQLDALALGTLKLSELGDKDAANIIAQLKKAGVNVGDPSAPSAGVTGGMMPPMGAPPASPSTPMASAPPGMPHMPAMPPMAQPAMPPAAPHPAAPAK